MAGDMHRGNARNYWKNDREFQHHGGEMRHREDLFGGGGFNRNSRMSNDRPPVPELATRSLMIQSKKFFLDIKETSRGRFLKLSEKAANGAKNRMTLEIEAAQTLCNKLTEFIEIYAKLGPTGNQSVSMTHKSDHFEGLGRRYYLDLKSNFKGRFLKISMTMPPPSPERADILIPAQGMVDLRDTLTDLLSEFGKPSTKEETDDGDWRTLADIKPSKEKSLTPTAKEQDKEEDKGLLLKSTVKSFHFKVGRNRHGIHLRISEVSPAFRTAVNIPKEIWSEFIERMKKAVKEKQEEENKSKEEATVEAPMEQDSAAVDV